MQKFLLKNCIIKNEIWIICAQNNKKSLPKKSLPIIELFSKSIIICKNCQNTTNLDDIQTHFSIECGEESENELYQLERLSSREAVFKKIEDKKAALSELKLKIKSKLNYFVFL